MTFALVDIGDIHSAYSDAEQAIKRYERLTLSLPNPAINQLRYAGFHILQAAKAEDGSDDYKTHCRKAIGHCKRATFDACEGLVLSHLSFLADFQNLCRSRNNVESVYSDYINDYQKVADIQERFQMFPSVQTMTEENYKELESMAIDLTRIKMKALRNKVAIERLECKLMSENRKRLAQQFLIPFVATVLGTVFGVRGLCAAFWPQANCTVICKIITVLLVVLFSGAMLWGLYELSIKYMLTEEQRRDLGI